MSLSLSDSHYEPVMSWAIAQFYGPSFILVWGDRGFWLFFGFVCHHGPYLCKTYQRLPHRNVLRPRLDFGSQMTSIVAQSRQTSSACTLWLKYTVMLRILLIPFHALLNLCFRTVLQCPARQHRPPVHSSCFMSGCPWPRYGPSSSLWSSSFLSAPRQTSVGTASVPLRPFYPEPRSP